VPLQEYEQPATRTFTLREVLAAITIQRTFRAKFLGKSKPKRSTGGFKKAKPDKARITSEMEEHKRNTVRSTVEEEEFQSRRNTVQATEEEVPESSRNTEQPTQEEEEEAQAQE
jgi:hypothetical protein